MNISKQSSSQVASYYSGFAGETSVRWQLDRDRRQSSSPTCRLQAGNLQGLNEKLSFSQFCYQCSEISRPFLKNALYFALCIRNAPECSTKLYKQNSRLFFPRSLCAGFSPRPHFCYLKATGTNFSPCHSHSLNEI